MLDIKLYKQPDNEADIVDVFNWIGIHATTLMKPERINDLFRCSECSHMYRFTPDDNYCPCCGRRIINSKSRILRGAV